MLIERTLGAQLKKMAAQFPVVAVTGPRQSGKTTLTRATFPNYAYVTLEDLDKRKLAQEDPRGFLASYANKSGVIIDEIQQVPELFSYLQGIVDQKHRPGFFILTGSQHFLMYEKITQTLAGRIALMTLLPLSVQELQQAHIELPDIEAQMIKGFYPRLYAQEIDSGVWCANYINTYVERDVRQILSITDVVAFQRFLKLCAARVGNILNYASIARDADISPNTAKAWISILESSYIIKLLSPYYKNFNKRVIKSPKLYFYDTALLCSLLGIKTADDLRLHPIKGGLFESLVISELFKYYHNRNMQPPLYFWRDVQGHEIDVIIEKSLANLVPIEIKAGMTIMDNFFKGIKNWHAITQQPTTPSYIVYGGTEQLTYKNSHLFPWHQITAMMDSI